MLLTNVLQLTFPDKLKYSKVIPVYKNGERNSLHNI